MDKIKIKVLDSSWLKMATYFKADKSLIVEMNNGGRYGYLNVPEEVARGFFDAESKGRYYSKEIKGKFESKRFSNGN